MADTLTPNYGWVQPAVGGDATTWGTTLNNDLALIDAQVYANEQASVLIGMIVQWGGGMTPPTNWILCDGSSYPTTGTYAKLFAAIGYTWGGSGANFNVPNVEQVFPIGANASTPPGSTGGAFSYAIGVAQLPSHSHPINDPTHVHTVYDPTHNHSQSPHGHTINDPGHAHGGVMVPVGSGGYYSLAAQPPEIAQGTSGVSGTGISVNPINANINPAGTGVALYGAATGITEGAVGGGQNLTVTPPFIAIPFIIRYQ